MPSWAQRAYTHWRIQLSDSLAEIAKIYHAGFSPNLIDKPRLKKPLVKLLTSVVKMRVLALRGETDEVVANSHELTEIIRELKQLIAEAGSERLEDTPIYGYVWLSLELAKQLERMTDLLRLALHK